ncbi:protein kinase [Histoplasma capsulatum G186AR]|uniref:non-specific serine/threonine protein kinase n=1 Tax=Ajellomyces capsulatus TaxID=5037 RepID=A0A8H8CS01_AJECA|nr:protein kinase [Histoplasma capsulatum]QSS71071.1 protein kinase [Histoplasma capsulatum G186AR]
MRPSILLSSQASLRSLRRTFLSCPSPLHAQHAQLQPSCFTLPLFPNSYLYTTMSSNMSSPLKFTDTGFDIVDTSKKFEEETLPDYHPADYYPARIGQVLADRYQIVGKLGYGVASTVWLGRDIRESRYVSLKISTAGYSTQNNEIDIYKQLESAALETDHVGKTLYRQLYGSFNITAPHGTTHTCLVQQPLGLSMDQYLDLRQSGLLSTDLLKPMLRSLLIALDFVHIAGVVHTDIQSKNILFPVKDDAIFRNFEETELKEPAPRKILSDNHIIYMTRRIPLTPTVPILTDFGDARLISKTQPGEFIMPHHYRAPEAILNMEWNDKVDIWNIAVLLWDLVSPGHLFRARIVEDGIQEAIRIAEMIAIMGPPPKEYLERSEDCKVFWDEDGKWKNLTPIPDITLESLAIDMQGEDKEGFLSFLRKILRWVPEERPTAGELVYDEWVLKGLGEKKWMK